VFVSPFFLSLSPETEVLAATYTPVLESLNGVLAHLDVILRSVRLTLSRLFDNSVLVASLMSLSMLLKHMSNLPSLRKVRSRSSSDLPIAEIISVQVPEILSSKMGDTPVSKYKTI